MNTEPSYYEARKSWQAEQMSRRSGRSQCRRCGRDLVFVLSKPKDGGPPRPIPCDPRLDYGDGHRTLVTPRGEMIPQAGAHVLGREPHFGTCPHHT